MLCWTGQAGEEGPSPTGGRECSMQKSQCDSKPYYLCLDDSSGTGINTAWPAPGAHGPLQEVDISKVSIMYERRNVRWNEKREREDEGHRRGVRV